MNIIRIVRGLVSFRCYKSKENPNEQYFYFSFPRCPLPVGFSHTDLGCGNRKTKATLLGYLDRQADIGIDKNKENTQADLICNLGLENLPLEDNSQNLVTAYDLLEHIPKVCVVHEGGKLTYIYPILNLFNEVYRVLRPGGYFEMVTPGIPNYWSGVLRDPTHVSLWCIESFDYFCKGRFESLTRSYGLLHSFEKIKVHWKNSTYIQAVLQKPPSC